MATEKSATATNTETYIGLSPYAAAQGQSSADSLTGLVSGAAVGAAASGIGVMAARTSTIGFMKSVPLFGSLVKGPKSAIALAAAVVGTVASSVMSITGYYRGQRIASEGRAQFEALKGERDMARAEVAGLQTQVTQLENVVNRKFAENMEPRAAQGSHAEKHGEHADLSHAENVRASQAEAENAERAV